MICAKKMSGNIASVGGMKNWQNYTNKKFNSPHLSSLKKNQQRIIIERQKKTTFTRYFSSKNKFIQRRKLIKMKMKKKTEVTKFTFTHVCRNWRFPYETKVTKFFGESLVELRLEISWCDDGFERGIHEIVTKSS